MSVGDAYRKVVPESVREIAASVVSAAVTGAGIGGVTALGHEVFKRCKVPNPLYPGHPPSGGPGFAAREGVRPRYHANHGGQHHRHYR